VFHVRDGRIRGQRGWVVEKVEDVTTADLVEHLLQQVYGEASGEAVPREVLIPVDPPQLTEVEDWLSGLRGSRVDVRVPQRGDKRSLMETVARNAGQALTLHKTKRAGDLTTRGKALQEIQEALDLPEAPLRIECYDVSHIQGSNIVASMVVFEDGLPRKGEYRRFTIKSVDGSDDVASIREVIGRRFRRYLGEQDAELAEGASVDVETGELRNLAANGGSTALTRAVPTGEVPAGIDPDTGRPKRFAYAPQLVVVDGGAPQVAAAAAAMAELGIVDVALCGLAKRLEEVWIPDDEQPVIMPRSSEGLYLLQRIRDEAHRFAITHHRQRRSTAMTASELDAVPGLGPARKKALLAHFGSVKKLRLASVEAIAAVPGVGPKVAQAVVVALAAGADAKAARGGVAVDMATGEIID
jgi:excinuclease ABC subunit C